VTRVEVPPALSETDTRSDPGAKKPRPNREQRHQLAVERMLRSQTRMEQVLPHEEEAPEPKITKEAGKLEHKAAPTRSDPRTDTKAGTADHTALSGAAAWLMDPLEAEDLLYDLYVNLLGRSVRKRRFR
jgi:hypothetical protein